MQLPQNYPTSASYGALTARPNASNGAYPSQHASTTVYSGSHPNIGLKTPSPSPTSLNGAPPTNGLLEDTTDHPGYSNPEQHSQQYTPAQDSYSGSMNQHPQYMDSQTPHMPGGHSYTSQASGGGSMPQYASYQQQPSVMHPGSNSYAPSPGGYSQYNGYSGVTSPHSAHQGSSSIGSQMLPLPSRSTTKPYGQRSANNLQQCRRVVMLSIPMEVVALEEQPRVTHRSNCKTPRGRLPLLA